MFYLAEVRKNIIAWNRRWQKSLSCKLRIIWVLLPSQLRAGIPQHYLTSCWSLYLVPLKLNRLHNTLELLTENKYCSGTTYNRKKVLFINITKIISETRERGKKYPVLLKVRFPCWPTTQHQESFCANLCQQKIVIFWHNVRHLTFIL